MIGHAAPPIFLLYYQDITSLPIYKGTFILFVESKSLSEMKERICLKQLNFMFMIPLSVFLISCSSDDSTLTNGDAHVTEEMNEEISNYIVAKNANVYAPTDK